MTGQAASGAPPQPSQKMVELELQKRSEEAEAVRISNLAKIIETWPTDVLAEQLIAIGLGALGTGGLVYVLLGYPGIELRTIPTVVSWILGFSFLAWGLGRLRTHTEVRLNYFQAVFKIQAVVAGHSQHIGVRARIASWFRRLRGGDQPK